MARVRGGFGMMVAVYLEYVPGRWLRMCRSVHHFSTPEKVALDAVWFRPRRSGKVRWVSHPGEVW